MTWSIKFLITLWYIWKWRCAQCLGGEEEVPKEKGIFLQTKFREVLHALHRDNPSADVDDGGVTGYWVRWEPPLGHWMVLNTDGAVKGNLGPAGSGGVLRGDKGEWITGFSESLGHCSSIRAELRVVLRGLKLAQAAHVQKLCFQVDLKVVVHMLTCQNQWQPRHRFLVQECQTLIS